ncbi:MAG: CHASE2 domain-containing protein [Verrucomicrobia bacterium]|nr:CHASE2 domain-containing protein [Verrucomicrobiota bacterium]
MSPPPLLPWLIAADRGVLPAPLFRDHAAACADIAARPDSDGVLRRARAFTPYRHWHPIIEQAAREYELDLDHAHLEPRQITAATARGEKIKIPLAADGTFDPVDFGGAAAAKLPRAKPFTEERVWHMGILLAARQLGLDLAKAEVDLPGGKIILRGAGGVTRTIPVDGGGYFQIDWQLPVTDPRLACEPVENLLAQDSARTRGATNDLVNRWRGKLVVIGSTATGNDLTDRGATPLEHDTVLMSKHWNVANSILAGRFIRRASPAQELLLIVALGALSAALTLRLRAVAAAFAVLAAIALYLGIAALGYVQQRFWLPVFLPVAGALLAQHVCLVTWRAVFEQAEKRRVRAVFSKIVAPEVVQELLEAENISLGGARREITIFFADVRGFTAFTDASRDAAAELAREKNLSAAATEALFDREARETLDTVNSYLALVADQVKAHGGTLDKYIGDCVMAFWNAPAVMPQHALQCVRAAIAAQRAIDALNRRRADANTHRELENIQRAAAGEPPLPPLPILTLGTGINTGPAVVGLMGSDAHILNYTAFGREVNLASRLEALSGRGRILIGEGTFAAIRRDDPALAAACSALAPVNVKGIREAVQVYEVPWRLPGEISPVADDYGSAAAGFETSATGIFRKS